MLLRLDFRDDPVLRPSTPQSGEAGTAGAAGAGGGVARPTARLTAGSNENEMLRRVMQP